MDIFKYIAAACLIAFLLYCLYRYLKMEARALEMFKDKTKEKLNVVYKRLKHKPEEYKLFTNQHPIIWVNVEKKDIEEAILSLCDKKFGTPFYAINDPRVAEFSYNVDEQKKFIYFVPNQTNFDFDNCELIHQKNH